MPEPDSTDDLEWSDNRGARRWEVRHGADVVAWAEYRTAPGRMIFTHTVVEPEYEGRGIASRLARMVLDDAVGRGLRITPHCPFMRAYVERHAKYSASLDMPPRRATETDRTTTSD